MPQLWVRSDKERKDKVRRTPSAGTSYLMSVLTGMALLGLGFTFLLVVGSQFQASRDQQVLYDQLRKDLADGKAPVSALTFEGEAVALGDPVAILSIPDLGAELVVVEGTTSAQTMSGPGHRRDTVLPGQTGISIVMGRQSAYGGFFGGIGSLPAGSEIQVTTGQGISVFTVDGVRRAGDPQPQPLAPGGARLTLISAEGTPFLAQQTVRVDATLVSTSADGTTIDKAPFPAGPRLVTTKTLPEAERPMSGDTSQAFALVLWAQLFLICVLFFAWAREKWGRWQTWAVGVPLLLATGWAVSNQVAVLLPNLL